MVVKKTERRRLALPTMQKMNGGPMGKEVDQYFRYQRTKGHHTQDFHIRKKDIEAFIQ